MSKVKLFRTKTVTHPSFPRGKLQGVASIPLFENSPLWVQNFSLTLSPPQNPHTSYAAEARFEPCGACAHGDEVKLEV